jgi:hypothetical protein
MSAKAKKIIRFHVPDQRRLRALFEMTPDKDQRLALLRAHRPEMAAIVEQHIDRMLDILINGLVGLQTSHRSDHGD